MFVFLIKLVHFLTDILLFIIVIDAVLSYFKLEKSYLVVDYIRKIADLILKPIRSNMKKVDLGFDISPLLAIIILKILEAIIVGFFNFLI